MHTWGCANTKNTYSAHNTYLRFKFGCDFTLIVASCSYYIVSICILKSHLVHENITSLTKLPCLILLISMTYALPLKYILLTVLINDTFLWTRPSCDSDPLTNQAHIAIQIRIHTPLLVDLHEVSHAQGGYFRQVSCMNTSIQHLTPSAICLKCDTKVFLFLFFFFFWLQCEIKK